MVVDRDFYLDKLIARQGNGLIKVITGARRAGKSFLLFNLFRHYLENIGVDNSHIVTMSFDDFANKELRVAKVFYEYIKERISGDGQYYVLLDEVQMLEDFVDVLNGLLHIQNVDVYVTGSNARFLSRDVVTEFRGRGDQIYVYPFCFKEFMTAYSGSIEDGFEEYMRYGGLPAVVLAENDSHKEEILNQLWKETYLTDLVERNRIKNDAELEDLLLILASGIGSLTNPQKLSNTFLSEKRTAISPSTLKKYIDYLCDAFLLEKVNRYDVKGRKYIDTPLKYYFTDIGLRNSILNFRQWEKTHLMENIVYNELRRRGYNVDVGVVVVNGKTTERVSLRKQLEIDFVANKGSQRIYVQSAYNIPDAEKELQETTSLLRTGDGFLKMVVVGDHTKEYHNQDGILFTNIYDFLLKV